ncbi:MAG: valine--tRNA ligase [archaeon]|nr:valine--tRNA ligase [archaeon]
MEVSKAYDPKVSEPKWSLFWENNKLFKFNPNSKKPIFSVDTPPPTISGLIHVGHAFSYSQAEFVVRFKRMKGFEVFYPFGFDDNGLPTEKYVEKQRGIKAAKMDRKEFVKICLEETKKGEEQFKKVWQSIGVSVDWSLLYSTISPRMQKASQLSFIELYEMGREYRVESPTIWCPECETAVAQAELEDKELESFFNDIYFELENGEKIIIATTRPELLPACVAIFVNPKDKRYSKLVEKKAIVPLFGQKVEIKTDDKVAIDKGTGIVMCCTFGDLTDIEWQKQFSLPIIKAINEKGILTEKAGKFSGLKIKEARIKIIEELKSKNLLIKQTPIMHAVNVHERCGTEIEFLVSKQWYIKYLDLKNDFLKQGNKIKWFPDYMKHRYDNWVKGLKWDWNISRQRYYGVPFPVWYCAKCNEVILADKKDLPVDPLVDLPKKPCPKCKSKEFIPEKDVLDTWASSSLTPLINAGWPENKALMKKIYPMSLRPSAHDIINTWAFDTIVKSFFHTKSIPWNDIMISGWGLDPHGKKMSKSKGNVIEPSTIIQKYSADALRFWAAGINLGNDMPFQEKDVITGQKIVNKLWNASKFCLQFLEDFNGKAPAKLEVMDEWLLHELNEAIKKVNAEFEVYEYGKAKAEIEAFFMQTFADNYLEIVKDRLYNAEKRTKSSRLSAQFALNESLLAILKMFAPILPFISEDIFQLHFAKKLKEKSIHISSFPEFSKKLVNKKSFEIGKEFVIVLGKVRAFKAQNQKSLKTPIILSLEFKNKSLFKDCLEDLQAATNAEKIVFEKEFKVVLV